ncbi:MAG: subclass B3 metallo-beta-lactamase [Edaphobacter sp.]
MKKTTSIAVLMLLAWALVLGARAQVKAIWTTPIAPFRIADNLYYVGSQDLAAYLVTTPKGNILINANLPSSPAQIRASVEKLGFRWEDTKVLLVAHAHFDHAGGAAEIQRETHAKLEVMEYDAEVMKAGGTNDFLRASGSVLPFPPAHVDRVLHDGDTVKVGDQILTAHRTGGHTRGCTTWTMRVHLPSDPAGRTRDVVIVGGYTMWSDYHLISTNQQGESYPGIADDFRRTFLLYRSLPCDIFLADHGEHFELLGKLSRLPKEGDAVWVDPQGYRATIDSAERSFEKNLSAQRTAAGQGS